VPEGSRSLVIVLSFRNPKRLILVADARLPKKDWPAHAHSNNKCQQQENGQQHDESQKRQEAVKSWFDESPVDQK